MSDDIFPLVKILHAQLYGGVAAIVILHDGIADIERIAGLDVVVAVCHVERDSRYLEIRLRFLDELKLHVHATRTHLASVAVIIYILSEEDRVVVARAEWLELLEQTEELRGDLGEIKL